MVGRLPYVHFTNRFVRGQGSFAYVVVLAVVLAFTAFYTQEMLAIGFTVYALSAPARVLWLVWRRRYRASASTTANRARSSARSWLI
jgi:phosphatidylserine synthase